ncbi:hypothetical protein Q022_02256 [Pseudomonas aeruginosa BWHPSA009]|nr:hypothetical protein Q022_02256 [Pseudomonas aeruginosa BWHPSA009]
MALSCIAGAVLGALAGGVAGCVAGATLGKQVDEHVLHNHRCLNCKYCFSLLY